MGNTRLRGYLEQTLKPIKKIISELNKIIIPTFLVYISPLSPARLSYYVPYDPGKDHDQIDIQMCFSKDLRQGTG